MGLLGHHSRTRSSEDGGGIAAAPRRARLGRSLTDEGGQTVVMFTIAMVAMLGFMSLVFDTAVIFEERRQLQNAADGAALAAARELPGSPAAAITAAKTYLAANGYTTSDADVSFSVDTTYLGNPEDVEVVVTRLDKPYLFARVLGLDTIDISARAVSRVVTPSEDGYAVFAIDSGCGGGGVNISGSSAQFLGTVHGNGDVTVSGSSHSFSPAVTFGCDLTENGSGHTYEKGSKSVGGRDVPAFVAGIDFDTLSDSCTFSYPSDVNLKSESAVWLDAQKTQLVDGVYCFDGDVSLAGNNIAGTVTFVARGQIDVSGSDHQLAPYHSSGILFYSESSAGPNQINLSGSGGQWSGLVYAPNGDVSISGRSNLNFEGSVVAQHVNITGQGMTIHSSPLAPNSSPAVSLIE